MSAPQAPRSGSPVTHAIDVLKATNSLEQRIMMLSNNLMGEAPAKPTGVRDGIKASRPQGLLHDLDENADTTFAKLVTANENLRRIEEFLGMTPYEEIQISTKTVGGSY
jgi:hypothetical protein